MENKMAKLTAAYFDSIGLKYGLEGDNREVISSGFGGMSNLSSIRILLIFDAEGQTMHLIAPQIVKVPQEKVGAMYKTVNALNQKFRWVKFYIDNDGDVMVDADCILDMDSCGQECLEIMQRTASIANEAFPIIMKELWS
jgi:hypothetical protein